MTLERLIAFNVNPDTARQVQVWDVINSSWNKEPFQIGRAGALVTLDRYGALAVYRGYVRPEDEPVEETAVQDAVDPAVAGQGADVDAEVAESVGEAVPRPWPLRYRRRGSESVRGLWSESARR